MKRALLRFLLVVLVLLELGLFTGLLPQAWQEKILARIDNVLPSRSPDYSHITHPNLNGELRAVEPLGMAVLVVMILVNGGFIVALWRRRER